MKVRLPKLWPHQLEFLQSPHKRKLVVTGRRVGKTVMAAAWIIKQALHSKGVYWWIGKDHDQVLIAQRFLSWCLADLDCYSASTRTYHLPNGSQIILKSALSDGLRGEGLSGIVLDEVAFYRPHLWQVVLPPCININAHVVFITTPNGHNWLYEMYEQVKDNPEWFIMQCPTWLSPLKPYDHVVKEHIDHGGSMSEAKWNQEHRGWFTAPEGAVWPAHYFDDILVKSIPPVYQRSGIGVDLSYGGFKSDWMGVVMLGYQDGVHYLDCRNLRTSIPKLLDSVKFLADLYRAQCMVFDVTGREAPIPKHEFERCWPGGRNIPRLTFLTLSKSDGSKTQRLHELGSLFENGKVKVLDNPGGQEYVRECRAFPAGDFDDMPDAHQMIFRVLSTT